MLMYLGQVLPVFQSTLPCGSDSLRNNININTINFNPRSLAGATHPLTAYQLHQSISIHAPLRERPMATVVSIFI